LEFEFFLTPLVQRFEKSTKKNSWKVQDHSNELGYFFSLITDVSTIAWELREISGKIKKRQEKYRAKNSLKFAPKSISEKARKN
jgi:hypothetical protein